MKARHKESKKIITKEEKSSFLFKHIHLLKYILFFLFSLLFLGIYNADVLYKTQEALFFTYTDSCIDEMLRQSAGPLIILSSFLTQTFYHPILGASILSLLLVALAIFVKRAFKLEKYYFLPSFLVLLTQTSVGYAIYDVFDESFLFSLVIGSMATVALIGLYQLLQEQKYAIILFFVITIIAYFIIGIYATAALLLFYISASIQNHSKRNIIGLTLSVALFFLLPYITATFIYYEKYVCALFAPLPSTKFTNVFVLSICILLLYTLLPFVHKLNRIKLLQKEPVSIAFFLASCFLTFFFSYREPHFRAELKMQKMAQVHDWEGILKTFREVKDPTKAIFAYRTIALANRGTLSTSLFNFSCKFEKSHSKYLTGEPIYYEDLFFYASYFNTSYLWSMEFWTTIGYSHERLKKMALCALLNEEYSLANKYIQQLKHTMFQSEWAEEYEKYVDNIDLLYQTYPDLVYVKRDIPIVQQIIGSLSSLSETYSQYKQLSIANAERRLLADLYNKDLKAFSQDFMEMKDCYKNHPLPQYFKEAIILCAMNGDLTPIKHFNIERPLAEKLKKFASVTKRYTTNEMDKAYENLKKEFEGYYCFYFAFANNKTK
ncbi:MAG: hypothetical protein J6S89_04385 [Paludibacteraceae bacterium]|nr:hypothetical protein [Paludibacteraceae bacterium]